jgi:predicted metal-binding protein
MSDEIAHNHKGNVKTDLKYFTDLALKLGADDAVVFKTEYIVFDSRTILKCMFGCATQGKNHTFPSRPAFHSVGIDVYKTIHQFGLPLKIVKDENEQQNWYSAVFIE